MSRLVPTMACDVQVQYRNGFWYAAAFVAVFSVLLLGLLDDAVRTYVLAPLVWSNLLMNTFYFLGGLVLLEKGEGTLEALIVTPLRVREYLVSKLATLTLLALIENVVIVLFTHGPAFRPLPFALGLGLASAVYCLVGFAVVVRYDSINEYLMPSFVVAGLLAIPLIPYFELASSPLFLLHPLHGSLTLLKAAFLPVPLSAQLVGLLTSLAWIVPLFLWSRRTFQRFVVAAEGGRRWR